MSVCVLTSMFPNGFPNKFTKQLQYIIQKRDKFAFVASDFENSQEKTDRYFAFFLEMFTRGGILFDNACVIDGRMTKEQMQNVVTTADVVWLAGGNTPGQYRYFEKYGLVPILREHNGVIIGMSAGAINMAKTAICSITCGSDRIETYGALGLVDVSVEPHFDKRGASDELLQISRSYPIYGLCDDSVIICNRSNTIFIGDIFFINQGVVTKIPSSVVP